MSAMQKLAIVGTFASSALAHGIVNGVVIAGKYYPGYNPSYQYQSPPPTVIAWSTPEDQDNGFVPPSSYSNPDIICHKGATNAGMSAKVTAGDKITLEWSPWPSSHHGPVLDYLANCNGKCETVDKTTLEFFKIDEGGLINDATPPGEWASDKLIANNNSWTVTIPTSIAAGNYVLRHEIIALHSAGNADGAQNYPQCFNLEISSSGSAKPSGTLGTALYKENDPGILINIYAAISKYIIPGPALFSGGSGSPAPSSVAAPASSSAPAASSSAPAAPSSAPAAPSSAPAAPSSAPAQSGGASYSPPASSAGPVSSTPPAASSAAPPGYGSPSSAPAPPASSAGAVSSSLPASSGKCTTTITLSSSSYATPSSIAAPVSSSAPVPSGPAGSSSFPSAPYYPISSSSSAVAPAGTGTSIPYPIPSSLTSPSQPSGTGVPPVSLPVPTGTIGLPSPSSSYPAPPPGYTGGAGVPPVPSPPAQGSEMEALLAKLLKVIKQMFRSAEHGRDFKRA